MNLPPIFLFFLVVVLSPTIGMAQETPQTIPLWPNGAPGFEARKDEPELAASYWVKNIHNPSITVFLPHKEKANGAAVLICPGGGHRELGFEPEGREPAEFFKSIGVAAFALKYRLGREPNSPYEVAKHPREDALRAMRLIRSHAAEWNVDPERVGMLGFSAGGEVIAMTAFSPTAGSPDAADPIDRLDAKPNFLMFVYPGPQGIPDSVPANAPPALLVVTNDDRGAIGNVTRLLDMYRASGASVEAHIFARGGHAFNMGHRSKLHALQNWPERVTDWMADNYISDPALRAEEERQAQEKAAQQQLERDATIRARNESRRKRIAETTELFDPTGIWKWERRFGDSTTKQSVTISRNGDTLVGTYESDSARALQGPSALTDIVLEANELSFKVKRELNGRSFAVEYHGTVGKDSISGYYEINFGGRIREIDWNATRTP